MKEKLKQLGNIVLGIALFAGLILLYNLFDGGVPSKSTYDESCMERLDAATSNRSIDPVAYSQYKMRLKDCRK